MDRKAKDHLVDKKIFIGLGSNTGNGRHNCMLAIKRISSDNRAVLRFISSFYSTSPVSDIPQDDFINCAVEIDWRGAPMELLQFLNEIESSMGRIRREKNGPRIIDLDILLYGDRVIEEGSLSVPHRELHRRKFAIMPCIEIDPGLVHPSLNKPLAGFLPDISDDQRITKLEGITFHEDTDDV